MPRTRRAASKREKVREAEPTTIAKKLRRKMTLAASDHGSNPAESGGINIEKCPDSKNSTTVMKYHPSGKLANSSAGPKTTGFYCDFSKRKVMPHIPVSSLLPGLLRSLNLIHYQHQASVGLPVTHSLRQGTKAPILELIDSWSPQSMLNVFDRRTTALEWHPTHSEVLVAGSKGGDIVLWNVQNCRHTDFVQGRGPGGNISAVKFHPRDSDAFFTASLDGRVSLHHMDHLASSDDWLSTGTWEIWYTALDVSSRNGTLVTGDNTGKVILKTLNREKVMEKKLHKNKVTHAEYSPREDWLLCTASVDHTVKVWDIRSIRNRDSYLCSLSHDFGVNSAYFSETDGCRLLTTDQNSQLRVYRAPFWHLERIIAHPHRFFQHLTPIKATWHPLQDLIIVGRYPDEKFPGYQPGERRTIDVIDADTGKIVSQIYSPHLNKITSLNKCSHKGDCLASGMGQSIVVRRRPLLDSRHGSELREDLDHENADDFTQSTQFRSPGSQAGGRSSRHRKDKLPKNKKDLFKA